jgi:hypothetical protein
MIAIVSAMLYCIRQRIRRRRNVRKLSLHPFRDLNERTIDSMLPRKDGPGNFLADIPDTPFKQPLLAPHLELPQFYTGGPNVRQYNSHARQPSISTFASLASHWSHHDHSAMVRPHQEKLSSSGESIFNRPLNQRHGLRGALANESSTLEPSSASAFTLGTSNYRSSDYGQRLSRAPESFTQTGSSISRIRFSPLTERQLDLQDRLFDVQRHIIDLNTVRTMASNREDSMICKLREDVERLSTLMESDWAKGLTDRRPAQLREDDLTIRL